VGKRISVSILCCTRLLRESIARILTKKADFQIIAVRQPGPTLQEDLAESGADVLVFDSLQCFAREEASETGTCDNPPVLSCVLVAMEDDKDHFLTAVRHGVLGYVLQEASAVDIATAIRTVARGEAICPPHMVRVLFDRVKLGSTEMPKNRTRSQLGLSCREQQLVPLIGRGLTNKEIANQLSLSEQTVKNHIHRMLRKVGVEDRISVFEAYNSNL
jgi:DNA-binding NarL/FixJ family response regulator